MTDRLIMVTSPDDINLDGLRLLLVDLKKSQEEIVSKALMESDNELSIISYIWRSGEDIDWLLDKKHKSHFIIFNAESENQILIGYLSAFKYSYHLGHLRDLNKVNDRNILDQADCSKLITLHAEKYERQFK